MKVVNEKLLSIINDISAGKDYRIASRSVNAYKEAFTELFQLSSHLNNIDREVSTSERLYCVINNVSNVEFCTCGKTKQFRSTTKGYNQTCGDPKCIKKAQKSTYNKNNPVHYFATESFKEKYRARMLENYNSTNYFSSDTGKTTIQTTFLKKYGVITPSKDPQIRQRASETWSKRSQEKHIKTLSFLQEELLKWERGSVEILCRNCNNTSNISKSFFLTRVKASEKCCTTCNPIIFFTSSGEQDLQNFIENIVPIKRNDRSLGFELDVFIPERKIAFEFNGIYWHNELYKDRNFHLNKTKRCEENGIRLFHVWQDDWNKKRPIVESRIKAILGVSEKVVNARSSKIVELSKEQAKLFFEENHLQGYVNGKAYGLSVNDEIVSAILIGKSRFKKGEIELLRFANKLNCKVNGGLEKLLANLEIRKLVTYCDKSWGSGKFYENKGFKFIHNSPPGFWYVINGIRENRFKYRKTELLKEGYDEKLSAHEIMLHKKIYRIYDCGSSKWSFETSHD